MATQKHKKGGLLEKLDLQAGNSAIAEWSNADPDKLVRAITATALAGGALRFGYTRDGGAYSLGVYGDGDPYTIYVKPTEDIDAVLDSTTAYFREMVETGSNGAKKR